MSRLHRIAVIAAACVIVNTSLASGQDRPVAFLHGAFSSSNTWQAAASALQQQLALEPFRPDTNPQSQISVQAEQVDNAIGFLPFSTVAVTHSNGGLVGRQWSRTHPLSGLVTMGTPNYGLPVVENLLRWADFNEEAYFRLSGLFDAFLNCASVQSCTWSIVSRFSTTRV